MCDDGADINSANLLMRWTLIWISAVASVKAKGVCLRAFIDKISEVICQHDANGFGNLPSSLMGWLIIDPCSNRLSVGHSCLWMPNESFRLVLSQQPNPINEWEWVSSSARVNLSLCHLSQIVYWWGPRNGQGHSLTLLLSRKTWLYWKTLLEIVIYLLFHTHIYTKMSFTYILLSARRPACQLTAAWKYLNKCS